MILDYIKYLLKARTEHSLHSPFLFDFYTKIIKDTKPNSDYNAIESIRRELLQDNRQIHITDFGTGSKLNQSKERYIKDIARNSQKSPKLGQLFHRIIQYYNYKNILDLGTSLGLTTAYLSLKNTDSHTITFEGCPQTAKIAQENFVQLSLNNIQIIIGNIDKTLPEKLKGIPKIDFAFFDANHRYEPTMSYFQQCLPKAHEESCFIFDDIYWSPEMKQAWIDIRNHPEVSISLDLFWIGIIFFRKKQPKQHFTLRF